jgi:hypothetical protein
MWTERQTNCRLGEEECKEWCARNKKKVCIKKASSWRRMNVVTATIRNEGGRDYR